MKTIRKIIGMIAAASILSCIDNAVAEDISGNVNAGIVSKNVLLSGKTQGETPAAVISGNMYLGQVGAFVGLNQDREATREINSGTSYQRKLAENQLGKLTTKAVVERKEFLDSGKELYQADLVLGASTKIGELILIYRERFDTKDFDSGRTVFLGATTSALNLGKIVGMDASLKGTAGIAFQDSFVGTSSELGYVTPGLSFSLRKGNTSIESFIKEQRTLRDDLDNITYGGVKVTYAFGGKK